MGPVVQQRPLTYSISEAEFHMWKPLPVTNKGHHTTVLLYRQPELKFPCKQATFMTHESSRNTMDKN